MNKVNIYNNILHNNIYKWVFVIIDKDLEHPLVPIFPLESYGVKFRILFMITLLTNLKKIF